MPLATLSFYPELSINVWLSFFQDPGRTERRMVCGEKFCLLLSASSSLLKINLKHITADQYQYKMVIYLHSFYIIGQN